MPTLTTYGKATVTQEASDWSSLSNVTGAADGSCALSSGVPDETYVQVPMTNFSISDFYTFTSIAVRADVGIHDGFGSQNEAHINFKVKDPSGSSYCAGHKTSTKISFLSCASSNYTPYFICTHWGAWTESELETGTLSVRVWFTDSAEALANQYIDAVQFRLIYTCAATIGTPGAPTAAATDSGIITITKPSNPSGSPNQWQARQTNDSWASAWTSTSTSTVQNTGLSIGTYTYDTRFRQTAPCIGTGSYGTDDSADAYVTSVITPTSDTTIQAIDETSRQVTRTVQLDGRDSRSISREVIFTDQDSRSVTRIVRVVQRDSRQVTRSVQRDGRDSRQITRSVQLDGRDSRQISRSIFLLQEFTKTSDTTVMKIGEISRVSNTSIKKFGLEVTKTSDSAIYREGYETLDISSDSRVKQLAQEIIPISSDSHIKNTYEVVHDPLGLAEPITSDSAIFRLQYGNIIKTSDARIVKEGTTVLPPIYSDTRIKKESEITKLSDSFIVLGQQIDKLSDTAIFVSQYGDITKTSDTAIFRSQYGDITKLSDSTIFKSGLEITKLSDTRIKREAGYKYPFQKQEKTSDTRIFVPDNILNITSLTRIKEIDKEITKTSDTLIIHNPSIQKTSDAFILIPFIVSTPSRTRIKNTMETSITSDATIFRPQYGDITKLSDTLIHREPIIDKTSDTTIVVLYEMSGIPSDTYIINEETQIDITSDTAIFRAGYGYIIKESRAAIKGLDQEITKLSDSVILRTFSFSKISDTAIRRDRSPMKAIFRKSRQL